MSVSVYNPWDSFRKLQQQINKQFDTFFKDGDTQMLCDPWDHTLGLQHSIASEFEQMRNQLRQGMNNNSLMKIDDEPVSPLWGGRGKGIWGPLTDVQRSDDGKSMTFNCELPSFPKDSIKVELKDGHLLLSGNVQTEETDKEKHTTKKSSRQFRREFALPPNVKPEDVKADWKGNKLSITVNNLSQPTIAGSASHPIPIEG